MNIIKIIYYTKFGKLNQNVLNLTDAELLSEIDEIQKRRILLFTELARRVEKKTPGEGFLSDENAHVAEYWLQIGIDHPNLIAVVCDIADFQLKVPYFKALITIAMQDNHGKVILKEGRDTTANDLSWYISYIRKAVQAQKNNPIYKLILQKE